jgi:hypothetical protein
MYLLLALIAVAVGASFSHGDIGDIPFAQLTLKILIDSLIAGACYVGAAYLGIKSLGSDRIWPWHWTLPYFGNLLVRASMLVLFGYGIFAFIERKEPEGLWLVAVLVGGGILLLVVLFSSEFEVLKEKKTADNSNREE